MTDTAGRHPVTASRFATRSPRRLYGRATVCEESVEQVSRLILVGRSDNARRNYTQVR